MALKKFQCENFKYSDEKKSLFDGGGLTLKVSKSKNEKLWVYQYTFNNHRTNIPIGNYNQVGLAEARRIRDSLKEMVAAGKDPKVEKQKQKFKKQSTELVTFSQAYNDTYNHYTTRKGDAWSNGHQKRCRSIYKNYLADTLGKLPLTEITDEMILQVLKGIYKDAPVTCQKAKHLISRIFRYATEEMIYKGINPVDSLKGNSLIEPPKAKHHESIMVDELGEFLYKTSQHNNQITKSFLYILTVTGLRIGSLINARWGWYDKKRAVLNIPPEYMKNRLPFICPLPTQAIKEFEIMANMGTEMNQLIFPISSNVPRIAVQKITKSKATAHGLRTTFNLATESMGCNMLHIGSQMSHSYAMPKMKSTYSNGYIYLKERTELVQQYADWCETQVKVYLNKKEIINGC